MRDFSELTPLELAQGVASTISQMSNKSLSEYTAASRVSAYTLIDRQLLGTMDPKKMNSLLQTVLSLYAGFYLVGINMAMQVGNVKVMRLLDQFNGNSDLVSAAGNSIWWSNEEAGTTVYNNDPVYINPNSRRLPGFSSYHPALEEFGTDEVIRGSSRVTEIDKTIQKITDESSLVVGKILDVKLVQGDCSITMPVQISLSPKTMDSESIVIATQFQTQDKTIAGRYHKWRAGELKFFTEYLLALDLVGLDRKAQLADQSGILTGLRSKRSKGILATVIRGYASPNTISAILIVTKDTAKSMERAISGNFKDYTTRTKYFGGNCLMTLIIVDTMMERFTVYQRGINDYQDYTFDDIKAAGKQANSVDIEGILKAYTAGNTARL